MPVALLGGGFFLVGLLAIALAVIALAAPLLPGNGDCVISFDCDGFVVVYGMVLLIPAVLFVAIGVGILERNPNVRIVALTLAALALGGVLVAVLQANDGAVAWGIGLLSLTTLLVLFAPATKRSFRDHDSRRRSSSN